MARRPAGINLTRARESLGKGQDTTVVESTLFGGRQTPPLESSQPLKTPWIQVDSTRIAAFQYDYSTSDLLVEWKNNHQVWVYHEVPVAVFETFTSAPSLGRYVNSTLGYFAYGPV